MKKLLALCLAGGLLCTITGCPNPSTGPTGKGSTVSSTETKGPGMRKKFERKEESTDSSGATKKEETKKEETTDKKGDTTTKKEETKKEEKK